MVAIRGQRTERLPSPLFQPFPLDKLPVDRRRPICIRKSPDLHS
jgi:hypothetical protein